MRKICVIGTLILSCLFSYQANGTHLSELVHTTSSPDTIYPNPINLTEDETRLICPDLTGFSLPVTITDLACESLLYGRLESISAGDECVTYTSNFEEGIDILCLFVSDATGATETFIYRINVNPNTPEAVDDFISTAQEESTLIRVMDNDDFTGNPSVNIITPSVNANIAVVDENGRNVISYTPNAGFCGMDSLEYQLCTASALCGNIATVSIEVTCDAADITVYNGFSPNNDNINDFLVIEGLEATINDKIAIFNRWGNLVFSTDDYQNDWNGKWNGEDLPDGTYFYVIDDGNGNEHHGYIELQR